jgi:hypothetical protein
MLARVCGQQHVAPVRPVWVTCHTFVHRFDR